MRQLLILFLVVLATSGCTPLINNSINNSCGGVDPKHSIKGESDQAPTTSTKASLGVGVGAAPVVSGGAVK